MFCAGLPSLPWVVCFLSFFLAAKRLLAPRSYTRRHWISFPGRGQPTLKVCRSVAQPLVGGAGMTVAAVAVLGREARTHIAAGHNTDPQHRFRTSPFRSCFRRTPPPHVQKRRCACLDSASFGVRSEGMPLEVIASGPLRDDTGVGIPMYQDPLFCARAKRHGARRSGGGHAGRAAQRPCRGNALRRLRSGLARAPSISSPAVWPTVATGGCGPNSTMSASCWITVMRSVS